MRFFRVSSVLALLAAVFAGSAAAFGFTDEALLPPDMQLGAPYGFQLSARSGCPPYYYEQQSGYFPGGVGMNRDGLISGTNDPKIAPLMTPMPFILAGSVSAT